MPSPPPKPNWWWSWQRSNLYSGYPFYSGRNCNQQRNQAFKQIHVSTVTTLTCHPYRDARPERSCSQIYKMGTGLYQRTETISIGFAKIAANRRVTGRRPAQLAILDDADAAAARDHPPDRRQHERHAAVCAGPVQCLAAERHMNIIFRHATQALPRALWRVFFLHTQICGKNIVLHGVFLIDKLPPPRSKIDINMCKVHKFLSTI